MATYKAVRAAVATVVDGVSGFTEAKTLKVGTIGSTPANGWFVVAFGSGATSSRADGGDVMQTAHLVGVQFIQTIDPQDQAGSLDAALDRVESVRGALEAYDALGSVDGHARYDDYDVEDAGGYYVVTVGFEVTHQHTV